MKQATIHIRRYIDSYGNESILTNELDANGRVAYSKREKHKINGEKEIVESWSEYDESGSLIYYRDSNNYEHHCDYDMNGNEIHFIDSHGNERWCVYDKYENLLYEKDCDGTESVYRHDDHGNEIYYRNSYGYEKWSTYDENGFLLNEKDNQGTDKSYKYDDKGRMIDVISSNELENAHYEYNEEGQLVYAAHSGLKVWYKYNDQGRNIRIEYDNGVYLDRKFYDNGYILYEYNSGMDQTHTLEYDDRCNLVYEVFKRPTTMMEKIYEYNDDNNVTHIIINIDGKKHDEYFYTYHEDR